MANLTENATYDAGVYQLELTDPVIGGPSGISNQPLKNLANRTKYLKEHVDALESSRAPLDSPAFTGTPTAPTASAGANNTQIATTAFVKTAVEAGGVALNSTASNIQMDGTQAAGSLATAARADHVHPSDSTRAPIASPAFTGTPTAPTATAGTNNTQLATTAFVKSAVDSSVSGYAPLESPALTGNPTAPTAPQFDNDTSLATTAFVRRALGSNANADSFSANTTLTAADVGKLIVASGSGNFTFTLPAASGVQTGGAIDFFNGTGANITVARGSTNLIWANTNGYSLTSITVGSGDTLRLVSNGSTGWIVSNGSAALKYSSDIQTIVNSNVLDAIAGASVGAVGTYAFLRSISANSPGATRGGSQLFYTSIWDNRGGPKTQAPAGTWRCMGDVPNTSEHATVWLRIS